LFGGLSSANARKALGDLVGLAWGELSWLGRVKNGSWGSVGLISIPLCTNGFDGVVIVGRVHREASSPFLTTSLLKGRISARRILLGNLKASMALPEGCVEKELACPIKTGACLDPDARFRGGLVSLAASNELPRPFHPFIISQQVGAFRGSVFPRCFLLQEILDHLAEGL